MAHCMKLTRAGCGHMFKHYERSKDEKGEYVKFGNQDIDTDRTHLNYNLAPDRGMSQGDFVKKRCEEVQCLKRKDINVMCSWVVTLPKEVTGKEDTEYFMQKTYEFLEDRYGKENVVSAYVHLDETQPHIHFAFVPVVTDKKKGIEKVSAKECISKNELSRFHQDLQNHFDRSYLPCNILNQATIEGNKSIEELKRGTAIIEAEKARNEALKAVSERDNVISELQKVNEQLKEQLDKLEEIKTLRGSVVDKVVEKKGLFGLGKVKNVVMPLETYQACLSAQQRADGADMQLQWAVRELNTVKASVGHQNVQRLMEQVKSLQADRKTLSDENRALSKAFKSVEKFFQTHPDIKQQYIQDNTINKASTRSQGRSIPSMER